MYVTRQNASYFRRHYGRERDRERESGESGEGEGVNDRNGGGPGGSVGEDDEPWERGDLVY